jgi:hypothetical protein
VGVVVVREVAAYGKNGYGQFMDDEWMEGSAARHTMDRCIRYHARLGQRVGRRSTRDSNRQHQEVNST